MFGMPTAVVGAGEVAGTVKDVAQGVQQARVLIAPTPAPAGAEDRSAMHQSSLPSGVDAKPAG